MNIPLSQRWHPSLSIKFVILVVGILAVTMGIVATVNYRSQNELYLQRLMTKGEMFGNFLAAISIEPILRYDFVSLNEYVRALSEQEDIVYAVVLDPSGRNLTNYMDEANDYVARVTSGADAQDVRSVVGKLAKHRDIVPLSFGIEFDGANIGKVALGLSRRRVDSLSRAELVRQLVGNTFIILLLSVAIYVVFRLNALGPIHQLRRGSERVAQGDLTYTVPVASDDELGSLTRSFNEMVGALRRASEDKDRALTQLQELNKTLEMRVAERTQELESVNKELEYLALHDPLTSLPNRTLILDRLQYAIRMADRARAELSILMIDLDRFKEINDTLGHHAGDELLKELGRRFQRVLRETDTVGRLGGDEFAVILPDTDVVGSQNIATKLVEAVEPVFSVDDINLTVTASIGIAVYPVHGTDSSALLKCADVAMYWAKQNRSPYFVYKTTVDPHSTNRLALVGELREAFEGGELKFAYQPIVDLASEQVVAMESLVRWRHRNHGYVDPDEFVPLAEQSGLIKAFTMWALDNALGQCQEWRAAGFEVAISVNLSIRCLEDARFPDQLRLLVDKWGAECRSLILEITESALMADPVHVAQALELIHTMGVQLAIDDFGTGYSSLNHLKKLPVAQLKIDKSFVTDMHTDPQNEAIVRATTDLAHNLGLKVVAEGVESAENLASLRAIGCDFAQGFYVAEPDDAGAVAERVLSGAWQARWKNE